jgi:hypothetical protein
MAGNSASEIANPTAAGSFQRLREAQQVGREMWLIAVARLRVVAFSSQSTENECSQDDFPEVDWDKIQRTTTVALKIAARRSSVAATMRLRPRWLVYDVSTL